LQQSEHTDMRHAAAMLACAVKATVVIFTALAGAVVSCLASR